MPTRILEPQRLERLKQGLGIEKKYNDFFTPFRRYSEEVSGDFVVKCHTDDGREFHVIINQTETIKEAVTYILGGIRPIRNLRASYTISTLESPGDWRGFTAGQRKEFGNLLLSHGIVVATPPRSANGINTLRSWIQ